MTRQPHVIGRQVLHLRLEGADDAVALERDVCSSFQARVLPALDELFERHAGNDTVVRIERLEIDLGQLDAAELESGFAARVCEALEPLLLEHVRAAGRTAGGRDVATLAPDDHVLATWEHVLQRGTLPWWAPPAESARMEARVLDVLRRSPTLPASLAALLREEPVARRRLMLQASPALQQLVLERADAPFANALKPVVEALESALVAFGAPAIARRAAAAALRVRGVREALLRPAGAAETSRTRAALHAALHALRAERPPLAESLERALAHQGERIEGIALDPHVRRILAPLVEGGERPALPHPSERAPAAPVRPGEDALEPDRRAPQPGEPAAPDERADDRAPRVSDEPVASDRPRTGSDVDSERRTGPEPVPADESHPRPAADGARNDGEPIAATSNAPGPDSPPPDPTDEHTAPDTPPLAPTEGEVLFVDDAGLVLLSPFLPRHFAALGLVRDDAFVDDAARVRAIHQLRYLATGEEEAVEPLLALAKILCGVPPAMPVPRHVELDAQARDEGDKLLEAVVRHWDALKNTSAHGLREGFLQREGKLTYRAPNWRLHVESRAVDVLLARLPWGVSVVAQPWMTGILHVEWA